MPEGFENIDPQAVRTIIEFLWQKHLAEESMWLWIMLAAPLIGLIVYLILWYGYRAHAHSLAEAIAFFFAPRGPDKMLIFKDLAGERHLIYNYNVVKGAKGYIVRAGPFLIKSEEDPESYAEPLSLVDARGPPGIPSPFGLYVRQLIGVYVMLTLIAVAFVKTFYVSYRYLKLQEFYEAIGFTVVDNVAFAALAIGLAWFIATLVRVLSPQTLVVSLSAIGSSEGYIEASPAIDVYSRAPPARLLASIKRSPVIVVSDSLKDILSKLAEEVGDRSLAASLLALLGQVYHSWRASLGILLQDRYDISVAARARYQLSEEKLPKGFLSRYAGVLAIAAIIFAVIAIGLWLNPSVEAVESVNNTVTNTTVTAPPTPATPPPPPTTTTVTTTVTPPQPPPPPATPSPLGGG